MVAEHVRGRDADRRILLPSQLFLVVMNHVMTVKDLKDVFRSGLASYHRDWKEKLSEDRLPSFSKVRMRQIPSIVLDHF